MVRTEQDELLLRSAVMRGGAVFGKSKRWLVAGVAAAR
jgi:hypothetical protein